MSQEIETIKFDINLSPTFWDVAPEIKVSFDGDIIFQGELNEAKTISQERVVNEGEHAIEISLLNKNGRRDTVLEDGKIVKDMLLNIDDISLDDIALGYLLHQKGEYVTESGETHQNCVNLGWNGTWKLTFSSPIYMWLLENL